MNGTVIRRESITFVTIRKQKNQSEESIRESCRPLVFSFASWILEDREPI